jgi:hypothetical protein
MKKRSFAPIGLGKSVDKFWTDFIAGLSDARPDGCDDAGRRAAELHHLGDRCFQDAAQSTFPARMGCSDDACSRVCKQVLARNRLLAQMAQQRGSVSLARRLSDAHRAKGPSTIKASAP